MIRFEGMPPEVMEAMCTPMHQILPTHFPTSTSPLISTVRPVHSGIQPGALFLGSMTAAMDRDLLARHHITHVVHVLEVDFPWLPISEKDLFRSFKINILDNPTADLRPHLESACEYIARALNTGGSVLVHCHQVRTSNSHLPHRTGWRTKHYRASHGRRPSSLLTSSTIWECLMTRRTLSSNVVGRASNRTLDLSTLSVLGRAALSTDVLPHPPALPLLTPHVNSYATLAIQVTVAMCGSDPLREHSWAPVDLIYITPTRLED